MNIAHCPYLPDVGRGAAWARACLGEGDRDLKKVESSGDQIPFQVDDDVFGNDTARRLVTV